MASKTVVELFDDLDGGRADETVKFALDGVEYEIDLSTANAASLRDTLAVYIGHAHRPARRNRRAAEDTVATVAASTTASSSTPTGNHARNGRNGKVSDSASMTAEIRRLASESAQKASQARAAAAVADDEETHQLPAAAAEPARPTTSQSTTVGPVPALVIPFMEAGL